LLSVLDFQFGNELPVKIEEHETLGSLVDHVVVATAGVARSTKTTSVVKPLTSDQFQIDYLRQSGNSKRNR
jgi:hypothetical protein